MSENSKDVQEAVRNRLDARGYRLGISTAARDIDTIVWETLAVLEEWEIIEIDLKNVPVRRAERAGTD